MSQSRAHSAARADQREVKPADLPLIGAARQDRQARPGQSPVNPVDGDWILPIVGRAIDRVMQRKEAALTIQMDAGQLARQLAADGHLSIRRLGLLGEDFWRALHDELSHHFGWHDEAAQLERAIGLQRAARAEIERLTRKLAQR